jgi:uncharacterized phiE125 gp8 family phage protein
MSLSLVTGPTTEPLTVAEVKQHLRLDSTNGEPAPTAPTVALVVAAGIVTAGAHRYVITFVTADGETEAGAVSSAVTTILATHGQVALSAIPLGGSAVTKRRIYRTAAGGTTYLLLYEITNNTATTYTDNIADGSLGAAAPSTNTTADPELVSWITAARQYCEVFTHRALITQTWKRTLAGFPDGDLWLPKPPLISISTATGLVITYYSTAGVLTTWAESLYTVEAPAGPTAAMGRVYPIYGGTYPSTQDIAQAVIAQWVAGYGAAAAVPAGIKAAMKLLIGHWWSHREAVNIGNITTELPLAVNSLLWPFKAF